MSSKYLEIVADFQYKALVEATSTLLKLVTVYFVIVGTTVGYVLSANIAPQVIKSIVVAVIIITILFGLVVLSVSWGVVAGLQDLKSTQISIGGDDYVESTLNDFFYRARIVGIVCIVSCVAILIVVLFGLILVANMDVLAFRQTTK